jgi:hypothetical protein
MTNILEGDDNRSSLPRSTFGGKRVPNSAIFLKRTALEFLQILFGTRAQGSFHYDSDDTKTDIQIADINAADLTAVNLRPAIIVARGPMNWQGLGLGGNAIEGVSMKTGTTTYNDLLIGSISISCISREGIEAEQIAHLVFNSFKFFTPTLRKRGFFSIKSLNIGGESLVEQEGVSDETYIVPIYVTAQIQERWRLSEDAARMLEGILVEGLSFET